MKATTIEAPKELSDFAHKMKGGYAVLARAGKPVAYLFPAGQYDEEDIGYMMDHKFWEMIRNRRRGQDVVSLEQIESDLKEREKTARRASDKSKRRRLAK